MASEELQSIGSEGSGAITWHDAQVYDTERLTLAFVSTAVAAGAEVANYIEAQEFLREDGTVKGVRARDLLNDNEFEIRSRIVINAAGPWVGRLSNGDPSHTTQFVKAINILVPQLKAGYAVGLPSNRRGRLFFVPWRGTTMIGTSYASQSSQPDAARATEHEINDLLQAASEAIPDIHFSRSDVGRVHCGLVPVNGSNGKSHRIVNSRSVEQPGVISIIGSKYTMARATAERVIDRIFSEFGYTDGATAIDSLIGGGIDDIERYLAEAIAARPVGVRKETIRNLVYSYGSEYLQIVTDKDETEESLLRNRVAYAIQEEMAHTLPDVVFRRTGLGSAGHPGFSVLEIAAAEMANHMGWNEAAKADQMLAVESEFAPS